jgi:hypothetical protein
MTKIFASGISILTVVLGTLSAQAVTSVRDQGEATQPQRDQLCAGATRPQIGAICSEGGSRRQVRYVSAPIGEKVTSNIGNRFNGRFE